MQTQDTGLTERESHLETVGAIRVLAISGSLRDASTNSALLRAAAQLAAPGVQVAIYRDLDQLPPFNPDLDTDTPPMPVAAFRTALKSTDAVLLSSPEYAHGVPGVLKNAIDVGSRRRPGRPLMDSATVRASAPSGARPASICSPSCPAPGILYTTRRFAYISTDSPVQNSCILDRSVALHIMRSEDLEWGKGRRCWMGRTI